MRKGFGFLLVIAAIAVAAVVAAQVYNVEYWMLPSKDKFALNWRKDVEALEKSGKLPEGWSQVREISLKTDNSPAQRWVEGLQIPIAKKQDGVFKLDVFVVHWIDNDRYGVIIQYNLVDLRNGNTTWELNRNLPLGRIL